MKEKILAYSNGDVSEEDMRKYLEERGYDFSPYTLYILYYGSN